LPDKAIEQTSDRSRNVRHVQEHQIVEGGKTKHGKLCLVHQVINGHCIKASNQTDKKEQVVVFKKKILGFFFYLDCCGEGEKKRPGHRVCLSESVWMNN
jgi:hypothetical protein